MNARLIRALAENPWINLIAGVVLFVTAIKEVIEDTEGSVGGHHGLTVFAFVSILRVLPHLTHGAEAVAKIGPQD